MKDWIRKEVTRYVRKYGTRDPHRLAWELGILVFRQDLGECQGCYLYIKRRKVIFLSQDLEERDEDMVLAHELGHAVLHRKQNCYFLRDKTLLLPGIEREANLFAAELLIPEETIREYPEYSVEQLSRLLGYREEFVRLKLKSMSIQYGGVK